MIPCDTKLDRPVDLDGCGSNAAGERSGAAAKVQRGRAGLQGAPVHTSVGGYHSDIVNESHGKCRSRPLK